MLFGWMLKPETVIELGRDYRAIVDSDTFERLRLGDYRWRPQVHKRAGKVYAQAHCAGQTFYLHRVVAGAIKGQMVDHKDGDGLNNRGSNLRLATPGQNSANQAKHKKNTTGFKGLFWSPSSRKWCAQIGRSGVKYYLGAFDHRERAAEAYDRAALALFGEFALLNFEDRRGSYRPRMPKAGTSRAIPPASPDPSPAVMLTDDRRRSTAARLRTARRYSVADNRGGEGVVPGRSCESAKA